ncbi:MAG TPA: tetratricopeptide repeat protein [Xanthomonadaceae bacterium]|nr:tetratricopeptide repeat protein [Xanthomonadaceae bacterium]
MKACLAVLLLAASAAAFALPPQVELDRLMLHAGTALDAKAYGEALEQLAQARRLGLALPEHFALEQATALAGLGEATEAKAVLDAYFNRYGTRGASYAPALALLVRIETGQVDARNAASAATAPAAPVDPLAKWGLTDDDLSLRLGSDIAAKVHLAERRPEVLAAAQAGDVVAQYLVAVAYTYGIGVAADPAQAYAWATRAADGGLVRALGVVGVDRILGSGTDADMVSGWALLLQAANAGNGIARYQTAILTLRNGYKFIERPTALAMLKRCAEQGIAPAQYALGHAYLQTTDDQRQDLALARYWLQKAAAQGVQEAAADLAALR